MKKALIALTLTVLRGQATFEAAAIKVNDSGRPGGGLNVAHNRIKVINSSLKFCVQVAWNVKDFQVAGASGWMDGEHYDIDAVAAEPFKKDEYRVMLKALLADRFGLVVHSETQDKPGYALVVGKNGPKLSPAKEEQGIMFSGTPAGDRTLKATSATMKQLASALSFPLSAIVVDQTGIEGQFDLFIQWTPDPNEPRMNKSREPTPPLPPDTVPGPTLFTVLQEKLGLKLESRKVPVEVIVIEHANRPSAN
jgi:uncharacterized protein (TIGR03435 family)